MELPANLRARQAKYPTDLLTREGSFTKWLSPEARNLTTTFLRDTLMDMEIAMNTIDAIVARELKRQYKLAIWDLSQIVDTLLCSREESGLPTNISTEKTPVEGSGADLPSERLSGANPMDDVF